MPTSSSNDLDTACAECTADCVGWSQIARSACDLASCRLTGHIAEPTDDDGIDADDVDPERLAVCAYWRCGVLFEQRSANQRFCRKACRSRQGKWQRAQERRAAREEAKQRRRRPS